MRKTLEAFHLSGRSKGWGALWAGVFESLHMDSEQIEITLAKMIQVTMQSKVKT